MGRCCLLFLIVILLNLEVFSVPIETPEFDERNEFVIRSPEGWGYRTFRGKNGLIGALWPAGTSFNSTDTAIFVFLQNDNEKLPSVPDNINLFTEKCLKANFKFSTKKGQDRTQSIAEEYFSGRCGRTMILFKEVIDNNYTVIIALVSANYVSKAQMASAKEVASAYREEIERRHKEEPD
ncbi:MAG: hypothetical protein LBF54_00175 [Holosporaceae bacterium]|jgi:hypothetical protein|nr:hypothetical protein [Holosporaceae bacterium]